MAVNIFHSHKCISKSGRVPRGNKISLKDRSSTEAMKKVLLFKEEWAGDSAASDGGMGTGTAGSRYHLGA